MADIEKRQKWYFDSCTLDYKKDIYRHIINKDKSRICYISHLALGEAYGNSLKKGKEEADAFIDLIFKINDYISVIGNDIPKEYFDKVFSKFHFLKMADSLHLATAINYKADLFITIDSHFLKISNSEVKKLSENCNGNSIKIKKLD
jgi:predicted nucleic acid-binding protein